MKIQNKPINKKMTIREALLSNENAAEILFNEGLMCVGCGMAQMETLEQGCLAHGMSKKKINEIIKRINGVKKEW